MTDVVDRLRREATRGAEDCCGADGSECCFAPWTCCDPKLLMEAADEIDRLRHELEVSEASNKAKTLTILGLDDSVMVRGRVTGKLHKGDQVPGMPNAICHACGLGYKCMHVDCPNDKPSPY